MSAAQDPSTRLGTAIREARTTLGWKRQAQLVDALAGIGYRVSQDTVSNWERGVRIPRPDEVIALERVLGLVDEGTLREARDRDAEERAEEIMSAASLAPAPDRGIPGYLGQLVAYLTSPRLHVRLPHFPAPSAQPLPHAVAA